jgi:hypothetical protein
MLLTAALAVVPAAATTPAFAADVRSHPTVRSDDHPGPPQLTDEQRACMEKKGFGPNMHHPGDKPMNREDMKKHWQDRMQAAKDCGVTGFPGPGRHFGPPMTDAQQACMEKQGFGPMHRDMNRPDEHQRPSREEMDKRRQEMDKRRQDFEKAAKNCGMTPPGQMHHGWRGWHHDGPGMQGGPGGPHQPETKPVPTGPGGKPA